MLNKFVSLFGVLTLAILIGACFFIAPAESEAQGYQVVGQPFYTGQSFPAYGGNGYGNGGYGAAPMAGCYGSGYGAGCQGGGVQSYGGFYGTGCQGGMQAYGNGCDGGNQSYGFGYGYRAIPSYQPPMYSGGGYGGGYNSGYGNGNYYGGLGTTYGGYYGQSMGGGYCPTCPR